MLKPIINYFDLRPHRQHPTTKVIRTASEGLRDVTATVHASVIPQYVAVSVGVVAEPLLRNYIETNVWQLEWPALIGRIIFGLIVGIILLPAVYKSSFDPQKPVLVQLAALFPMGIGWQSLFTSATKIGPN